MWCLDRYTYVYIFFLQFLNITHSPTSQISSIGYKVGFSLVLLGFFLFYLRIASSHCKMTGSNHVAVVHSRSTRSQSLSTAMHLRATHDCSECAAAAGQAKRQKVSMDKSVNLRKPITDFNNCWIRNWATQLCTYNLRCWRKTLKKIVIAKKVTR